MGQVIDVAVYRSPHRPHRRGCAPSEAHSFVAIEAGSASDPTCVLLRTNKDSEALFVGNRRFLRAGLMVRLVVPSEGGCCRCLGWWVLPAAFWDKKSVSLTDALMFGMVSLELNYC